MEKNKQLFKQTWWDNNLQHKFSEFQSWIGDYNAKSKVFLRNYVKSKNYKQILDCGCGPATEYFGYINDGYQIDYNGVDSSSYLVGLTTSWGINVTESPVEHLPFEDRKFESVFCRHVLEHLPSYEDCLLEMIRVAQKEVMVVWFIKPGSDEEKIDFDPKEQLFHNCYNKEKLEAFLEQQDKIESFFWEEIDSKENLLHIFLKE